MKKTLLSFVKAVSKPFVGKGILDTYFPTVNAFFQRIYASLQTDTTKQVTVSTDQKIMVYSHDVCVGISLILKGAYEPITTNLFLDSLKKDDVVVDIGANIGYYSLLASKKIGKKGVVFAFEPDDSNIKLLKKNISLNNIDNIKIEETAVTDTDGIVQFSADPIHTGKSSIVVNRKIKSKTIKGVTLDEFFKNKNRRVNVIKMDIEGAELLALKGAKDTISNSNIVLFLEYNPKSIQSFGYSPDELIAYIFKLGFSSISIIDETRGKVIPYSKNNLSSVIKHTTYCNLMCKKI